MKRFTKGRLAAAGVVMAALSMMLYGSALAVGHIEGGATATVTVLELTITLTDSTAVFGDITPNTPSDTTADPADDLRVDNDVNSVTLASLEIKINAGFADAPDAAEANCDNGVTDWEFDTSIGGAFSASNLNTFTMEVDSGTGNDMIGAVDFDVEDSDVSIPNTALAANTGVDIDLRITTATEITELGATCTISMTITALAA